MKQFLKLAKNQQGATLIVGLIMLVLLTIIGMAAMNITTVDVKVTANAKDRQLAFIGAESALFEGGQTILNFPDALDNTATGYAGDQLQLIGNTWWNDKNNWSLATMPGTLIDSEYKIEAPVMKSDEINVGMGNIGPDHQFGFYPTTAKSTGPGRAVVILQSHYVKKIYSNIAK